MPKIHWTHDLQSPTKRGTYMVNGVGEVRVELVHIQQAAQFNGDCYVDLIGIRKDEKGHVSLYIIGQFSATK